MLTGEALAGGLVFWRLHSWTANGPFTYLTLRLDRANADDCKGSFLTLKGNTIQ